MATRPVLHLIDGSGYIFRAYYAIRPLSTRAGLPTNAVFGFARMLLKLLREERPARLGIAFDTNQRNFRHDMLATYKANREVPPEDLAPQFALIHELVRAMDIPVLMHQGFEADDILATLGTKAIAAGYDVVLVTADKDLMQLVSPHLSMFDPMKDKHFGRHEVIERFGVGPEHVADVLALCGDTSDNIPGVPKVGPKTASKLVAEHGDVEAVIAALARQPKRKAAEQNVIDFADQARLSKKLTLLDFTVPVALDSEALRYTRPDPAKLGPFLQRIEAHTMLKEFGFDVEAPAAPSASPATPEATEVVVPTVDHSTYQTVLDAPHLTELCQRLVQVRELSVAVQTGGAEAMRAEVLGIALAAPEVPAAYIPLAHRYLGAPTQLAPAAVLEALRPVLENAAIAKVGHNLKYETVVLARAGIKLRNVAHDAMLAAYVLDPARPSFNLDALAREVLGHHNIAATDLTGTGKSRIGFDQVQVEQAATYAAETADVGLKLCQALWPKVQQAGLTRVYRDIEVPLVAVLADLEGAGIRVDTEHIGTLSREFNRRLIDIENEAHAAIGTPVNLGSPKQLAYLFFEKLGYPVIKKTKTGYSTDQDVLEVLARTYELPRIILHHRLLSKLKSTYVDALPKMVHPHTGRVHTCFNQTGTATGRLSSSDPNLQNIPIRSEDGRRIREAFVAPNGWEIVSADYSQVELRIMAHLSQDEHFVDAFARGEDIHKRTAQEILGHLNEPAAELRRRAKAINFGILYGLSEFGLSRDLKISRAEAHAYIAAYFARYPRIRHFLDSTIEGGRQKGFVTTMTGRRRHLPNLRSKNGNVRSGAERIAMNTPIQGSAADLIKLAMLRVHAELQREDLQARLLLQVHDELVLEAPVHERQAVTELLKREMAGVMQLLVPIVVDVGYGRTWAEAH